MNGVKALLCETRDGRGGNLWRLIGGVVEELDFELVFRPVDLSHGVEQADDHVGFVEDRELNRHHRKLRWQRRGRLGAMLIAHPEQHQHKAVRPVDEDRKQDQKIEPDAGEELVHRLRASQSKRAAVGTSSKGTIQSGITMPGSAYFR
jgi:hypothetical protein